MSTLERLADTCATGGKVCSADVSDTRYASTSCLFGELLFETSGKVVPLDRPATRFTLDHTFRQFGYAIELFKERRRGLVPSRDHLEIDVAG